MRSFEELSLKELKKQYDLSANNAIEYLKEFVSKDQYNESVENILSNLNIDENILYMNIEDIPDKGYLEGDLITEFKNLDDSHSYTVARVMNMCHCVELHYCDGKTTIEYGYRIKPDYWENEIYEVEWFNKNMSYDEMKNIMPKDRLNYILSKRDIDIDSLSIDQSNQQETKKNSFLHMFRRRKWKI